MKKIFTLVLMTLFAAAPSLHAHSFWINAFESHVHQPPHAMVSIGWGHTLPMGDILTSPNGRIAVDRFELFDPDLKKTDLFKPEFKLSKPDLKTGNFDLFSADQGIQKVALKQNCDRGVYQFSAASIPNFYTKYIDKKGKTRIKMTSKDRLDDIQKILMCVKYQAFAKSYLTVGAWASPAPLGHGLEIIPQTDLSNLHVGDLVEVDVLFYGQPLTATAESVEYITARSNSFGQSDGFYLMSYIIGGKARFRVQSAGQWMIGVNHKNEVTADGSLKDLHGKADQVYHGASLTFTVF